jgi:carbonic anhydrase
MTPKRALISAIGLFSFTVSVFGSDSPVAVGSEAALAKLKAGNDRFVSSDVSAGKPTAAKRAETANAQHPFAIILGCADSRVTPEIIFDQNIGDLFVIRTAGNLVDDHALGSIEYAVEHLGVRLVVVLGHESCGAVKAALADDHAAGHVQSLVRDIQPAVKATKGKPGDRLQLTVTEHARLMAGKIRSRVTLGDLAKEVQIMCGVYDLDTGKVEWGKD